MTVLVKPELKVSTRIKLKDGCEAVISDNDTSQQFRMMDLGKIRLQKINISEIDSYYVLGVGWRKFQWKNKLLSL